MVAGRYGGHPDNALRRRYERELGITPYGVATNGSLSDNALRRHYERATPYLLLPTSYSLLPTPYFLLPTSYFLLPTSYFLLPTSYLLLPTTSCLILLLNLRPRVFECYGAVED